MTDQVEALSAAPYADGDDLREALHDLVIDAWQSETPDESLDAADAVQGRIAATLDAARQSPPLDVELAKAASRLRCIHMHWGAARPCYEYGREPCAPCYVRTRLAVKGEQE